jgi:hypothetical protein
MEFFHRSADLPDDAVGASSLPHGSECLMEEMS